MAQALVHRPVLRLPAASCVLFPGRVLTTEPGLYMHLSDKGSRAFWNIGIRIEDHAIVTETGCEPISHGVPVKADEIEAVMRG